jgi:sec-independent protein translocase protein TatB
MFDIGWTEMLVIAVVLIVVVGPKDLPRMLRTFGRMTTKMRGMASDFQKQFNEALKEAELDDVKKSVDAIKGLNPTNEIKKHINPFEKAANEIRAGVDAALKPKPAEATLAPAAATVATAATTHPAEPLKNGATAMPGVEGPSAMPEPPLFPADGSAPAAEVSTASAATPAKPVAEAATPIMVPAAASPSPAANAAAVAAPVAAAAAVTAKRAAKGAEKAEKPAAAESAAQSQSKARPAKPKAEPGAPAKAARKPAAKKPTDGEQ